MEIFIFVIGVLVGIFSGVMIVRFQNNKKYSGVLRIVHSDQEAPYMFFEVSKTLDAVEASRYVMLKVDVQNIDSHK